MREFASPFTLNATGVIAARLTGNACGFSGSVDLTVANGTGTDTGKATLTLPSTAKTPAGVYTLRVQTDCGCYSTPVYTRCGPNGGAPTMPPSDGFDGDGGVDEPIETCPAEPTCAC